MHDFWGFHIFGVRDSLIISRKPLTSLKLFVEKKYLRSRRAPRVSTKTPKVQKYSIYAYNWSKNTQNLDKIMIL